MIRWSPCSSAPPPQQFRVKQTSTTSLWKASSISSSHHAQMLGNISTSSNAILNPESIMIHTCQGISMDIIPIALVKRSVSLKSNHVLRSILPKALKSESWIAWMTPPLGAQLLKTKKMEAEKSHEEKEKQWKASTNHQFSSSMLVFGSVFRFTPPCRLLLSQPSLTHVGSWKPDRLPTSTPWSTSFVQPTHLKLTASPPEISGLEDSKFLLGPRGELSVFGRVDQLNFKKHIHVFLSYLFIGLHDLPSLMWRGRCYDLGLFKVGSSVEIDRHVFVTVPDQKHDTHHAMRINEFMKGSKLTKDLRFCGTKCKSWCLHKSYSFKNSTPTIL